MSFVTEDLEAYRGKPGFGLVSRAARVVEVPSLARADDLAGRLAGRLGSSPVDGVICRDEVHLHAAASLARDLGLPHESLRTARVLGDKAAVRALLDRAGIGSLRWREAAGVEEGLAAVDDIGLPAVVKPTAGGWSVGVTVAWSRDEAARALAELFSVPAGPDGAAPRALVEEYAVGRHVSAEMLVQDGRTVLLGFAERLPAPLGTTAELGGHFPARFEGAGAARVFARRAVEALGIRSSAVHMELLITPTGPELIEVNGRVAGHVVTRQMSVALGRSLTDDLVALATGSRVEDAAPPETTVALHQLFSPVDGTVRDAPARGAAADGDVIESRVDVRPGRPVTALRTNHDRFGYVLARGRDGDEAARTAARTARQLIGGLRIDTGAAPVATADPAAFGEHLLLLLGPDDPADRILAGIGAATARLSVVWTGGEVGRDEARKLWRRSYRGQWRAASTPEQIREAARQIHAADRVRATMTCSPSPYSAQLRTPAPEEATALAHRGPGTGAAALPGHTVVVAAGRDGVHALAVVDDAADARSHPSALPDAEAGRLREQAVRAVRETGVRGVFRWVLSGSSDEPALLPGLDAGTIDLYDAVHTHSLVTAVAETALGRSPRTGRRPGVAVQRSVTGPAGPFRVLEATTSDELCDRPDLFRAQVFTGAGRAHFGTLPLVWLRHTVTGDDHEEAVRAAERLERSLVLRTAPAGRTHVLLLDRLGGGALTRADGSPLLPADRFRVSVLSSSDVAGPADLTVRTDLSDELSLRALAHAVHEAHPVHRVATLSERLLEPAAALRELLGAEGDGTGDAHRFVDKAVMKRIARRHGIRSADGLVAHSPDEVLAMYDRHGKVVLKPRASSGSQGVKVIADWTTLQSWLREEFTPGTHLCEEFVDAPMCHIDAVVHGGAQVWDVSLYERDTMALRQGLPLSSATVADPAVRAAAGALLGQVVDAWQVRSGVLHLEAFVTGSRLTFCEVAGRPGGGGVSEAFRATRGIDLDQAKLLSDAGGNPLTLRGDPVAAHAGWTVHYAPHGGTLLRYDDSAVAGHAYARSVGVRVGDQVPASRFSGTGVSTHVFARDAHADVGRLLLRAERDIRIVTAPAEPLRAEQLRAVR
ncbi:ATP-grasp domain-containing protein [Streptomyces sp. NPDC051956]|uniref:ATP-grasp domain-containing protein n=1 Tax=Streptomyces sp. NPDC051956 TaxID=3365677 RepID=UPI0037D5E671